MREERSWSNRSWSTHPSIRTRRLRDWIGLRFDRRRLGSIWDESIRNAPDVLKMSNCIFGPLRKETVTFVSTHWFRLWRLKRDHRWVL